MNNVILICLWFGEIPEYFKYHHKASLFNSNVDFLIITDQIINDLNFLGFVEDKMGINFMNSSHPFDNIKIYTEIRNASNILIFSDTLELIYNVSYYIHTGIKDNYTFTIYDMSKNILLKESNYESF